MKSSNLIKIFALLLVCALCLSVFASCKKDDVTVDGGTDNGSDNTQAVLDYSQINIDEYVKSVSYKGLTLAVNGEGASKETAIWEALLGAAVIEKYPESAVEYYFEQTKDYYMFIANNDPEAYELLLKSRNMTEEDLVAEARELVKKDLVYLYIVEKEGIAITEDEKQSLFDRYVAAYVSEYGYSAEYVKANMSELIYDSMLYDKTLEFLILNNTFTADNN